MYFAEHTPIVSHSLKAMPTVDLSPATEEGSYIIARVLMQWVDWFLGILGLNHNENLFTFVYACLVFLISWGVGTVLKWIVVFAVSRIGRHWSSGLYSKFTSAHFFTKCCRIIPPLIFLILIQFTLTHKATLSMWLGRITWIYVVYVVTNALTTLAGVMWQHIDEKENTRRLPLKGLLQLVKGGLWIISGIVMVAIIFNRSPGSLLAGLGAFAAVLMLVFKDSILGLVAGVQLSQNDSLHVGDWIKVPGTNANGTVLEVNLTAVKVQNWDKTITSLPPYSLVSGSFTNYRSMQESHSRQIQRSYMVDADSVVECDDSMLDSYERLPLVGEWVRAKRRQKAGGKEEDALNSEGLVDGSINTNLGVFRAYLKLYLDAHPQVDHSGGLSYCFVTTLAQTSTGIPLQIYCFTATSAWLAYEAIQASIFEHFAVMMRMFGLYTFENPTGRDTLIDGYLSPGKNPDVLFGLPYPFFNNGGSPQNPAYPAPESPGSQQNIQSK